MISLRENLTSVGLTELKWTDANWKLGMNENGQINTKANLSFDAARVCMCVMENSNTRFSAESDEQREFLLTRAGISSLEPARILSQVNLNHVHWKMKTLQSFIKIHFHAAKIPRL